MRRMRRMAFLAAVVLLGQVVTGQVTAQAQVLGSTRELAASKAQAAAAPAAPASAPSPPASAYGFGYDDEGRLIEASDPSGSTATYQWDKAGNLLSVGRQSSASVSVTQLAPAAAAVGATVRIYGTGFSTTPSQDTVKFNGTQATVGTAYTFELIVTVPSGAATGDVTVTAPGGSASSPAAFTVTSSEAPSVSSLSTNIATAGTQLTATGTNFSTTTTDNTVAVNQTRAMASAATATTLTWTVPGSAGSGHVSVETPYGLATGPDLYVPPAGYSAASVVQASRMTLGGSQQVTIGTSGGIAMLIFDATAGQQVFVSLTGSTFSGGSMLLYDPYNNQMVDDYLGSYIDTTALPTTGTYTLLLAPSGTGSATVTLYDPVNASYSVTPSQAGAAVAVSTPTPGQNASITFSGTAGERIFIQASAWTYTSYAYLSVDNPDGTTFSSDNYFSGNGTQGYFDMGETTLPQTGTYTVFWDPQNTSTGSTTLTFYQVAADTSASVSPSAAGVSVAVSTATPGQNASITFSGTAGERIFVEASNWTYTSYAYLSVDNPDGTTFSSDNYFSGNGTQGYFDMGETTLPQTGTYTVFWDPQNSSTGSTTLTIFQVPADTSASVSPSAAGVSVAVSTATPGQNASFTFSGTAGERIFIQASNWTYTSYAEVTVKNPDGTTFSANNIFEGNGTLGYLDMDETTLPQTGTYTVFWDPQNTSTGSTTLTFYKVPADTSASVSPSAAGVAKTVTTATPGQNASFTFSGTAGERIFIQASNWTYTSYAELTVKNPDGTTFSANNIFEGNGTQGYFDMDETTLPQTGTYTVFWDPQNSSTGSTTLTFYKVPADTSASVSPSAAGVAKTVTTATPGQNASFTFSGTAGERIFIQASNWAYTGYAYLTVKNPDGTTFSSDNFFSGNGASGDFDMDETTLPQTGTYTVFWDPLYSVTGSTTLTFYKVPADTSGAISIGGSAQTVTVTTPGQNGKLTFAGTAGTNVTLTASSVTLSISEVSILNPGGTTLTSGYIFTAGGSVSGTLGSTGTYTILVDPQASATGSMTLTLTDPPGPPAQVAGVDGLYASAIRQAGLASEHSAGGLDRRALPRARQGHRRYQDAASAIASLPPPRFTTAAPAFWAPGRRNFGGDWNVHQVNSPWAQLPPLASQPGVTALAGQVLQLNGKPLAHVEISVEGAKVSGRTDGAGRFLLTGLPAGQQVLDVNSPGTGAESLRFATFEFGVTVAKGQRSILPFTIWMPELDPAHTTTISSPLRSQLTLKTPRIPGLEVRIPAGSTITGPGGKPVRDLSIIPVPVNRPPFPLPLGSYFPVYLSVQPAGAYVSRGAEIIYPNYSHLPPGQRVPFWNYEPQKRGWFIYGEGTVSANGKQIIPDPGVRVWQFTGAMIAGNPKPPTPPIICGPGGADPVNLGTGLFVYQGTDLTIPGALPIALTRVYRPDDTNSYSFGIGTTNTYDMRLWSQNNYQTAELILPDGGDIHYVRTSPGTSYTNAVYQAQNTCTNFYDSTLTWNGTGWSLRLRDGTTYIFAELQAFGLSAIRDRFGNQITITRDSEDNLLQITGPSGRWITFTHDADNRITSATDSAGRTVTYAYNAAGELASVTDPAGNVTNFTYDPTSGAMTQITDRRGNAIVTNVYDANDRLIQQTIGNETEPTTFSYALSSGGQVTQTTMTNPDGAQTTESFSSDGYPTSITQGAGTPEAQTTTYQYQAGTDFLTSQTDQLGRTTTYGYDSLGNLTTVTQMAGTSGARTTTTAYDPVFSQPTSVTDPNGKTTTYGYDSTGELTSVTDPLGNKTVIAYADGHGQPTSVTDPAGNTTSYSYTLGDLSSITDPDGNTTTQYFDGAGRQVSSTDPLGNVTLYGYDPLGDLTSVTDPDGGVTTYAYDPDQDLTSVTDPDGNTTKYTYNNEDWLATKQDAMGNLWTYGYDNEGDLTSVTDPKGQTITYQYDPLSRLIFAGYTAAGGTSYQSTTSYTYDGGNRLTQAADSVGGTFTQTWDNFNELSQQAGPNGTVSYTYDNDGNPLTATVSGQPQISYGYNADDQLTSVAGGGQAVALAYDADSRPLSVTLPDQITENYSYDPASQVTGITYTSGSTTLGALDYAYDPDGNRTAEWGSYASLSIPQASGPSLYNADNALVSDGATSYGYDADGNLTSDGTNTYTWNARGELTGIAGPVTASFTYDPFGRREQSTVGGTTTGYLYQADSVVQQLSGSNPTVNYLLGQPGSDERYSLTGSAGTQSYLTDALGSVIALASSSGSIQTTYTYDPFGTPTANGAASSNPYQYAGEPNDGTGLQYNLARYYDPSTGQFISQDPLGLAGSGTSLYQYADDDPVNLTDPTGLDPGGVPGGSTTCGLVGLNEATSPLAPGCDLANGDPGQAAYDFGTGAAGAYLDDTPAGDVLTGLGYACFTAGVFDKATAEIEAALSQAQAGGSYGGGSSGGGISIGGGSGSPVPRHCKRRDAQGRCIKQEGGVGGS